MSDAGLIDSQEAELHIERVCRRVVGSQHQSLKRASRAGNHMCGHRRANPAPAVLGKNVKPPEPSHRAEAVEPAAGHYPALYQCAPEPFTWRIEPVRSRLPFGHKPAQESESFAGRGLAQRLDQVQVCGPLDRDQGQPIMARMSGGIEMALRSVPIITCHVYPSVVTLPVVSLTIS